MRAFNAQVGKGGMNYASAYLHSPDIPPPSLHASESFESAGGTERGMSYASVCLTSLEFHPRPFQPNKCLESVKWRKKG